MAAAPTTAISAANITDTGANIIASGEVIINAVFKMPMLNAANAAEAAVTAVDNAIIGIESATAPLEAANVAIAPANFIIGLTTNVTAEPKPVIAPAVAVADADVTPAEVAADCATSVLLAIVFVLLKCNNLSHQSFTVVNALVVVINDILSLIQRVTISPHISPNEPKMLLNKELAASAKVISPLISPESVLPHSEAKSSANPFIS